MRASLTEYRYHLAICNKRNGAGGYHHVSFELESVDAVESAEKALVDRGVATELSVDDETKRSFYLRDPDGFLSEYYVRRASAFPDLSGAEPRLRPFLV